jgi:UDP-2,3-diacylglucosamine hydrolase
MKSLLNQPKSPKTKQVSVHFISDLHLDPQQPQVVEGFLNYLESTAQKADALYILGDFFEAWIGDDFSNTFTRQIIKALRSFNDRGIPVFFMHGNRDFLIGETFIEQTGCQLLGDPTEIDLFGRKALLMHGDTLCTDDIDYQNFRKTVRDPQWQIEFLGQSLEARLAIAQNLRAMSKEKTGQKKEQLMDVSASAVVRIMADHGVDLLIHGHTHRPAAHQLEVAGKSAQRYVLGDWGDKGWQIIADQTGIKLESFPLQ